MSAYSSIDIEISASQLIEDLRNDKLKMRQYDDGHKEMGKDYQYFARSDITSVLKNPKKDLENIATDFIVEQMTMDMDVYEYFIKITNDMYNAAISKYKEWKELLDDDILFLYKGGGVLRINYLRQKEKFSVLLGKTATDAYFKQLDKYFKISDADFTLLVNPDIHDYDSIFADVNMLSYHVLKIIREYMVSNIAFFMSHFGSNSTIRNANMRKLFTAVQNLISANRDNEYIDPALSLGTTVKLFALGSDVIGEPINPISNENVSIHKDSAFGSSLSGDNYVTTINGSQRYDWFIKPHGYGLVYYTDNMDAANMYISVNEGLRFKKSAYDILIAEFNLQRIKLNFKFVIEKNDMNYMYNVGGEVIDVSIPKKDHHEMICYRELASHLVKYESINGLSSLAFYGFDTAHMIDDIHTIIAIQYVMPWHADKYEKRIYRLFALYAITLLNCTELEHIQIYREIFAKLIDIINTDLIQMTSMKSILDKFSAVEAMLSPIENIDIMKKKSTYAKDEENEIEEYGKVENESFKTVGFELEEERSAREETEKIAELKMLESMEKREKMEEQKRIKKMKQKCEPDENENLHNVVDIIHLYKKIYEELGKMNDDTKAREIYNLDANKHTFVDLLKMMINVSDLMIFALSTKKDIYMDILNAFDVTEGSYVKRSFTHLGGATISVSDIKKHSNTYLQNIYLYDVYLRNKRCYLDLQ